MDDTVETALYVQNGRVACERHVDMAAHYVRVGSQATYQMDMACETPGCSRSWHQHRDGGPKERYFWPDNVTAVDHVYARPSDYWDD